MASWLARRSVSERRLLVLAALLGFAALIQHWYTIAEGIQTRFAADVRSYQAMAQAAPHFPAGKILQPFAERFPFHWLVGVTSDAGVSLDLVYRVASLACLLAIVLTVHATVSQLGLAVSEYGLAMAALVATRAVRTARTAPVFLPRVLIRTIR